MRKLDTCAIYMKWKTLFRPFGCIVPSLKMISISNCFHLKVVPEHFLRSTETKHAETRCTCHLCEMENIGYIVLSLKMISIFNCILQKVALEHFFRPLTAVSDRPCPGELKCPATEKPPVFFFLAHARLTCYKQDRVVWKPVNANPGLFNS